jgi:sodium/bile acid cotransporter 7
MKYFSKISLRNKLGILIAAATFVLVTVMGDFSLSSKELTDEDKRQKVEKMYDGYKKRFPEVEDISPKIAAALAAGQKVVFIDVREPEEQRVSMLPGAISDKEFLKNPEKYKDHVKIGYCTISYRSGKFAQKLRKKDIPVYNLRGGILAWVHDGGRVYDQSGETQRIHVYDRHWDLAPKTHESVW